MAFFQEGPGLRKWQWTDCGMKVINVTNILGDGTVNVNNTSRFISSEEYESRYQHFAVDDGDIVVASSGNTYGKVGQINKSHLPLMMNTSVIRFHPVDPKQLNQGFLFAFLRSTLFKNQVESFVIGSAQPNFGPSHLKRMFIPCPPLPTQRKIASILSAYDDLIENNIQRIATLEEMTQAIYREWFVNFNFPGHENVKLVDSPLGQIPEGWEILPFMEIADFVNGFAFKPVHKEPTGKTIIKIAELKNGITAKTPFNSGKSIPEKYHITNGDVLFSWSAHLDVYIWMLGDGLLNQHLFNVLPKENSSKLFLYFSLKNRMGEFHQKMNGATMKHIKRSALSEVKCCMPDHATRLSFETIVSPLIDLKQALTTKQINLRITRDLMLEKLLSGELDVENLDINTSEFVAELEEATT